MAGLIDKSPAERLVYGTSSVGGALSDIISGLSELGETNSIYVNPAALWTNVTYSKTNITLTKGLYIVFAGAGFSATSGGGRQLAITPNKDSMSNAYTMVAEQSPGAYYQRLTTSCIIDVTTTSKIIYLTVLQTAPNASVDIDGVLSYIKIK